MRQVLQAGAGVHWWCPPKLEPTEIISLYCPLVYLFNPVIKHTRIQRTCLRVCVFRLTQEPQLCSQLWIFLAWQNIGYALYASRDTTLAGLPYYYFNLLHRSREQVAQISLVSALMLPQLRGIPGRLGHVFIKRSRAAHEYTSCAQSN